jgi:hypothetical protein
MRHDGRDGVHDRESQPGSHRRGKRQPLLEEAIQRFTRAAYGEAMTFEHP